MSTSILANFICWILIICVLVTNICDIYRFSIINVWLMMNKICLPSLTKRRRWESLVGLWKSWIKITRIFRLRYLLYIPTHFFFQIRVLDIGAGDGEVTARLVNAISLLVPDSNITLFATESSWVMRSRLAEKQIQWVTKKKCGRNTQFYASDDNLFLVSGLSKK